MDQYRSVILAKVNEVLALARDKYPNFELEQGDIKYRFVKAGQSAGKASWRRRMGVVSYGLQFSLESAHVNIDEMINDTIPHEIAHIVNYVDKDTGNNHDYGWRNVCINLGGTGERTHNQTLSKAKYRKAYLYVTDSGSERIVRSAAKHRRLQNGGEYIIRGTRERYSGQHFVRIITAEENRIEHEGKVEAYNSANGVVTSKPAQKAPIVIPVTITKPTSHKRPTPATHGGGSKKDRAKVIFTSFGTPDRQTFIKRCINELEMTKAGASTYYYNFNTGKW